MNLFGRFLFGTLFLTLITEALTDAAADPEALDKLTLNVNLKDDDEKGNNENGVYEKDITENNDYDASKDENEDGDEKKSESDDYDTAIVPVIINERIGDIIKPEKHWGTWGPWGHWSRCSVTCGQGTKTRRRKCRGGKPGWKAQCRGRATQTKPCHLRPCDYYHWCPWSNWRCSVTCGEGTERRYRTCEKYCHGPFRGSAGDREKRQIGTETDSKSDDGEESGHIHGQCYGRDHQERPCHRQPCESQQWCPWQQWGQCDVTCGTGRRKRHRTCEEYCPDDHWKERGGREKRETKPETESNSENEQGVGALPPWGPCGGGAIFEWEKCNQQPCHEHRCCKDECHHPHKCYCKDSGERWECANEWQWEKPGCHECLCTNGQVRDIGEHCPGPKPCCDHGVCHKDGEKWRLGECSTCSCNDGHTYCTGVCPEPQQCCKATHECHHDHCVCKQSGEIWKCESLQWWEKPGCKQCTCNNGRVQITGEHCAGYGQYWNKETGKKPEGDAKETGKKPVGDAKETGKKPEGDSKETGKKPEGDAKETGKKPAGDAKETGKKPEGDSKKTGKKGDIHRKFHEYLGEKINSAKETGKKAEGDAKETGKKAEGDSKETGKKPEGDAKETDKKPEGDAKETGKKPEGDFKETGKKAEGDAKETGKKAERDAKETGKKPEGDAKETDKKPEGDAKETGKKAEGDAKETGKKAEGDAKETGKKAEEDSKETGKKPEGDAKETGKKAEGDED